ncbi:DUF996 domain-containing protein [Hydrogenobaculum acidophilum]
MEENSVSYAKVNISKQKLLGGIGVILMLLGVIPSIGTVLWIVGGVLLILSVYQISAMIKKPEIFNKFIVGFVLGLSGWIIAIAFGLMSFISIAAFSGFMYAWAGIGVGIISAMVLSYLLFVGATYFYKQAYTMLGVAINHNLFKTAGFTMFIGAVTIILFGIGGIVLFIGWIMLCVAFFTAPDEVELST